MNFGCKTCGRETEQGCGYCKICYIRYQDSLPRWCSLCKKKKTAYQLCTTCYKHSKKRTKQCVICKVPATRKFCNPCWESKRQVRYLPKVILKPRPVTSSQPFVIQKRIKRKRNIQVSQKIPESMFCQGYDCGVYCPTTDYCQQCQTFIKKIKLLH
jgi:hypothetical protein